METDDDNPAPQPSQYYEHVSPDIHIRLGMEIHRPLLEPSLGCTMIPVNQEFVAADGRFHRPPTSLDSILPHDSNSETTMGSQKNDSGIGLPLPESCNSLPRPGQVKDDHILETVPPDEDTEDEVLVTDTAKIESEMVDAHDED